jgi:hypothetical protein
VIFLSSTDAYISPTLHLVQRLHSKPQLYQKQIIFSSASASSDADFSAFADSLEEEDDGDDVGKAGVSKQSRSTSTSFAKSSTTSAGSAKANGSEKPWQMKLEELLDPATSVAERQVLLSELLSANEKIRDSVVDALTNRKVRSFSWFQQVMKLIQKAIVYSPSSSHRACLSSCENRLNLY